MAEPLVLAVPSKGRLQSQATAHFAGLGLDIIQPRGSRTYRGALKGAPAVEVAFLSASEIVGELATGGVHLGVTGRDLVEENVEDWQERIDLVAPLGFGAADVVVAVPEAWIDVETMADLDDVAHDFRRRHGRRLKVATKYFNLTRRFFAGHGIADYRIVESLGATEGTPASGTADLIVDITSSGATLAANGLKRVPDGTILKSEAYLVASLAASWGKEAIAVIASVVEPVAGKGAAERLKRKVGA